MITHIRPKDFSAKFEATGCYLIHDGKVLFMKRDEPDVEESKWSSPGGTVDNNDSAIDTVTREIWEEAGLKIDKNKLIFVEKTYVIYPKYTFVYHIFKYFLDKKPEIKLSKEHSEYQWLTPEDGLKLDLILDEDYCIKRAFNIN
jgi:8-oxo-dGTP pyrophosphatase MutT (NUDIX family)